MSETVKQEFLISSLSFKDEEDAIYILTVNGIDKVEGLPQELNDIKNNINTINNENLPAINQKIEETKENVSEMADNLIGQKTPEGGEIFNDYENNKALSLYSEASGELSYAGLKGYYFHWEDGDALNIITLDDVSEISWEVNSSDNESFVFFVKKDENEVRAAIAQRIVSISGNKITVESMPFTEDERTNFVAKSWICWNHQKPDIGNVIVDAQASHTEGTETAALNYAAHVEGRRTIAKGYYSHAEGSYSQAQGNYSHAEGYNTKAIGSKSHAEGQATISNGIYYHAEGLNSVAEGSRSHAEGESTRAIGSDSHVEGCSTKAISAYSHAEGYGAVSGNEEYRKDSNGNYLDIEGTITTDPAKYVTKGIFSHAEGHSTKALGIATHAEGELSEASGDLSHAEGSHTKASGDYSHSEGYYSAASGKYSHAESNMVTASGENTHAEGYKTAASGKSSHAEGSETRATGTASHAEGTYSTATGLSSHAEGQNSHAKAYGAHAEGIGTQATKDGTHSEGQSTSAEAYNSHAEGLGTIASGNTQHVQGKYNIKDMSHKYAHIVGNGTTKDDRSNAHTIDWDGNAWFAGEIRVAGTEYSNAKTLATQEYVNNQTSSLSTNIIQQITPANIGAVTQADFEHLESLYYNLPLGPLQNMTSVIAASNYIITNNGYSYYCAYDNNRADVFISENITISESSNDFFTFSTTLPLPIPIHLEEHPFSQITILNATGNEGPSGTLIYPQEISFFGDNSSEGMNYVKIIFGIRYGENLQSFKCELHLNAIWSIG